MVCSKVRQWLRFYEPEEVDVDEWLKELDESLKELKVDVDE